MNDLKDIADRELLEFARESLTVASHAISRSAESLDACFLSALRLLDECVGKVVVTGVGKSGIAARKLAATLTSTGCPALYMHPTEALHGDLGIVEPDDVVVAISNGGESEELLAILPAILSRNVPVLAIVGNQMSTLAKKAQVVLDASIERESCPHNLAPTTSVVVAMALGDALAMALEKKRNFSREDYARNHPGGRLGRRLTLRVRDLMANAADLPVVSPDAPFVDVLAEITSKHMGATCVIDSEGKFCGIIAESDLRRALQMRQREAFQLSASDMANPAPSVTLGPDEMAYAALQRMEERPRPLSVAPVLDREGVCVGMVHIHLFIRAGL